MRCFRPRKKGDPMKLEKLIDDLLLVAFVTSSIVVLVLVIGAKLTSG